MGRARFIAYRVVGHVEQGVGAIYDHYSYLNEKHQAVSVWARHAEAVVAGTDPSNVLPFQGRA